MTTDQRIFRVTNDLELDTKLSKAYHQFVTEHNPMDYANGCGLGIGPSNSSEIGISLYFETSAKMKSFPFKGDTFEGIPVYRRVVGTIRAL